MVQWITADKLSSFALSEVESDQVGYYSTAEAFTDLVPIGILGRDRLSGVVPASVVNSLLVPSVLSALQASEDPLKSKSPILTSHGTSDVLLYLRLKKHRPCLKEGITLGTRWCRMGEEGIVSLSSPARPISLLSFVSFLSFWSHHQIFPGFYEWRLPESGLGNGWLKKTFEKMRLSKLSPLIKPTLQWEREKKKAK